MRKKLLLSLILFVSGLISAQDCLEDCLEDYPKLKKEVTNLDQFIPKGWELMGSVNGDINKDGIMDYVFILESKEKYKIPDDFMNKEYSYRILGISFGKKGGGYHLALQNNNFIINGDQNSSLDEPFLDMEIKKNGTIWFKFYFFYSAGSWWVSNDTYVFRYQNNRFELIGHESSSFHRATHEESTTSTNFSTKMHHFTYTDENGKKETVTKKVKDMRHLLMEEIDPYDFNPLSHSYGEYSLEKKEY